MSQDTAAFKLKNANFHLFVLHLLSADLAELRAQLQAHLARAPEFLAGAPIALNLTALGETVPDFTGLLAMLRELGLSVAGLHGGTAAQREAATAAGLGLFPEAKPRPAKVVEPEPVEPEPVVPAAVEPPPPPPPPPEPQSRPTLVIDKPVRAGQRIHAEGGNLVVLAIVNAGAELIADGDIHVYAPLRGRALAGARGDTGASIFVQSLEAELVSIAGLFQLFEDGIPAEVRGKPARISLDGERIVLRPLVAVR